MLSPSDSDSDSGYEDYHVEFRDAPGHRESYYEDVDENGGGSCNSPFFAIFNLIVFMCVNCAYMWLIVSLCILG